MRMGGGWKWKLASKFQNCSIPESVMHSCNLPGLALAGLAWPANCMPLSKGALPLRLPSYCISKIEEWMDDLTLRRRTLVQSKTAQN